MHSRRTAVCHAMLLAAGLVLATAPTVRPAQSADAGVTRLAPAAAKPAAAPRAPAAIRPARAKATGIASRLPLPPRFAPRPSPVRVVSTNPYANVGCWWCYYPVYHGIAY